MFDLNFDDKITAFGTLGSASSSSILGVVNFSDEPGDDSRRLANESFKSREIESFSSISLSIRHNAKSLDELSPIRPRMLPLRLAT